jgi:putative spermidine/putrescine transport system permease protein
VVAAAHTDTRPAGRGRGRGDLLGSHRVLQVPALVWVTGVLVAPVGMLLGSSFLRYDGPAVVLDPTLENYTALFSDRQFLGVLWSTVWMALVVALVCAVLAYPVAHFLVRSTSPVRPLVVVLVVSPIVASVVVRTYGWLVLLEQDGLVSRALQGLGLVDAPTGLRGTHAAIIIGLVHVLLPFSVFTTMSSLQTVDPSLERAARDLGAGPVTTFFRVTFPLSLPGVMGGLILVFAICLGAYATPAVLGGGRVQTLATLVQQALVITGDWAQGAAVAVVILGLGLSIVSLLTWSARGSRRQSR